MNATKKKEFESLRRVDNFANSAWPPLASLHQGFYDQLEIVRSAISDVDHLFTEQQSGAYAKSVKRRAQLRAQLRTLHLQPMRKISRVLSRETAGMPRIVNLPHHNAQEQVLVASAKATLEDATPYRDRFIARGAAPDFLDKLQNAIAAVEQARDDSNALRARVAKTTAGIEEALVRGRDAVRCMDTVVRVSCAADPLHGERTLAAWENASRVERVAPLPEKAVDTAG